MIICCRVPIITNNKLEYIKAVRLTIKEKRIGLNLGTMGWEMPRAREAKRVLFRKELKNRGTHFRSNKGIKHYFKDGREN